MQGKLIVKFPSSFLFAEFLQLTSLALGIQGGRNNKRKKTNTDHRDIVTMASDDEGLERTPSSHRISKAKKGKRVYGCDYPGCNKVSSVPIAKFERY